MLENKLARNGLKWMLRLINRRFEIKCNLVGNILMES